MLNLRQTVKTLNDLETSLEAALAAGKSDVVARCMKKVDGIVAELRSPELFAPPKNKGGRPKKPAPAPVAAQAAPAKVAPKKSSKKQQELPVDSAADATEA